MTSITGWLASTPNKPLQWQTIDAGLLGDEEVEVRVDYCGVCHSDLSVIRNEWNTARYPFIPGHEVIGTVSALGDRAKGLRVGQRDVSGSPTGAPMDIARMLAFAARHDIRPQVEHFAMSRVNDAIAHLEAGKARGIASCWMQVAEQAADGRSNRSSSCTTARRSVAATWPPRP